MASVRDFFKGRRLPSTKLFFDDPPSELARLEDYYTTAGPLTSPSGYGLPSTTAKLEDPFERDNTSGPTSSPSDCDQPSGRTKAEDYHYSHNPFLPSTSASISEAEELLEETIESEQLEGKQVSVCCGDLIARQF